MGLDLGLKQAGIETSVCCEIDKWCCNTIRLNDPHVVVIEDSVSELNPVDVAAAGSVDPHAAILVGGPPCQSFSSGGKRAGLNDCRGNLILEYFRFVKELRPQAFVFENVGNLLTAALLHRPIHLRPGKHWNLARYARDNIVSDDADELSADEQSGTAFKYLLTEIYALGYSITFGILNSADYGAPQKRVRFCMLGFRDVGAIGLPSATHGEAPLRPTETIRGAIHDLMGSPGPHSIYTEEVAQLFRLVPPGGNWRDMPEPQRTKALGGAANSGGGKTGFMRRLHWDEPAPTLTTKANRKGTAVCHPQMTRPLSVLEYRRLQGFPDSWQLTGAMNQQYQQLGNAVPTHLGAALGRQVLATLEAKRPFVRHSSSQLAAMTDAALVKLRSYARNGQRSSRPQLKLFAVG
jgi:DNA (cytosine-5)-methyltransferase 1